MKNLVCNDEMKKEKISSEIGKIHNFVLFNVVYLKSPNPTTLLLTLFTNCGGVTE